MPSITVRNVPEETSKELAARAARRGQSLQEYLRHELVELASRSDPEEWVQRVRARVARMNTRLTVEEILEHRDADRK
jgi:plasmid stability protein